MATNNAPRKNDEQKQLSLDLIFDEANSHASAGSEDTASLTQLNDSLTSFDESNSDSITFDSTSLTLEDVSIGLPKRFINRRKEIDEQISQAQQQLDDFLTNCYDNSESEYYQDSESLNLLTDTCTQECDKLQSELDQLSLDIFRYETRFRGVYDKWFNNIYNKYILELKEYLSCQSSIMEKYSGALFPPTEQREELNNLKLSSPSYVYKAGYNEQFIHDILKNYVNIIKQEMNRAIDTIESDDAVEHLINNKLNQFNMYTETQRL